MGTHAYNILGANPDLNSPDIGAAYLPQNQDLTLAASAVPGATAVTTDLLRPHRGLAAINTTWGKNWNGYDSIQTTFNRRFRNGLQATFNHTLSVRTIGNTSAQLRLQHNADGTFVVRSDQAELEKLLRNTGNRRHVIKANFVWDLPDVKGSSRAPRSSAPSRTTGSCRHLHCGVRGAYDATFSYSSGGASVNLTGSPSYAARIRIVGDPGSGCSSNQYTQSNTAAFAGPEYNNSTGLESGSNLMSGCLTTRLTRRSPARFRSGASGTSSFAWRCSMLSTPS